MILSRMMKLSVIIGLLSLVSLGFSQQVSAPKSLWAETDSTLKNYTLEELQQYQNIYSREITRLEHERQQLRRQGIRDGEIFLSRNPKSRYGDKVMMRLAELYYEQSKEDFQNAMQEFDRVSALYDRGEITDLPREPKIDYAKSLDMYVQIIENYPLSDLVDDSFYNIGYILEEQVLRDSALVYYQKILQNYPNSPLMPDVYMQIGEYYFNPPVNNLDTAISFYEKVLQYRESIKYDEALYRLGWSYYRLSEYPKAISYFTLLVDDILQARPYDPQAKYSNPALLDETIEYIGLSFIEYGGPAQAMRYINEIGGRSYGIRILKRMGDAYLDEKEDYNLALESYDNILKLYADDPLAPQVQNRIVQAYRRAGNNAMAFLARDMLFTKYRDGSDWWLKNDNEDARQVARMLTESALRDNISVLLNRGQETNQVDLFQQAVQESRRYLAAFPSDSSAPLIHWNMALTLDSKLNRVDEAYDEYLKISNIYWDTKYQRFAAENAVAIARDAALSAVASAEQQANEEQGISISELKKLAGTNVAAVSFRERMRLQPKELTPVEVKLAAAYDNYIKLFPHGKETPIFLANAGALYYRRHQFKDALRYFNTLLRHFPGSEEVSQARYAIMESYFGKADFSSSEIIARQILRGDATEEVKSRARRRLAESIYLNAEILAEDTKFIEAGNEYRRVVREVPDSPFADLALFNAALQYDKGTDFVRGIDTYNLLLATYPTSAYALDAQNNLAFDYAEIGDFRNAALTYERLSDAHPDADKARDALYNSSLYFTKASDWDNSIRVNRQFIKRHPQDDMADNFAFDIGRFYRNLNQHDKAQDAYEQFISNYPTSPGVIQAHFIRGDYYRNSNEKQRALLEFEKAYQKNKEFIARQLSGDDYYAAEAQFAIAKVKYEEFENIKFRLPESNLNRNKQAKREQLLEIVRCLGNCVELGTPRLYEATHMIGQAYQEFAATWADQEIPIMDPTRRAVAQKEVNDAAIELYSRAVNSYRNAVRSLDRLLQNYEESLISEMRQDTTRQQAIDTLQVVSQDSVLRIGRQWIDRSKENLAQVHYQIGEISLKSVRAVLNAPIPSGLGDFPELVYRNQVLDLAVQPLIEETVSAYQANIQEADSFRISSQWLELSKTKMLVTNNLLAGSYGRLALDAMSVIKKKLAEYDQLIGSRQSFNEMADQLQVVSDELANTVDFSKAARTRSTDTFKKSLDLARELSFGEKFISTTQDTMLSSLLTFALKCDSLGNDAKRRANFAREQFVRTEDLNFEEGLFTFESNYFALRDVGRATMEQGYEIATANQIDNLYSRNLAMQLIRFDPEKYAEIMNLQIQEQILVSDTTWKATPHYFEGWAFVNFDDSNWLPANYCENRTVNNPTAIWLYELPDPIVSDSMRTDTLVIVPALAPKPYARVFFRKHFVIQGLPVTCKINVSADQTFGLYFNGDLIRTVSETNEASTKDDFDVSSLITEGKNVISLEVLDLDQTANGVQVELIIRNIPDWNEKLELLRPELANEKVQQELMLERGRLP